MRNLVFCLALFAFAPVIVVAEPVFVVERTVVTDWKAVFGRIEARDRIPARARLGGTLVSVDIEEGDRVTRGQVIATVVDEKISLRLGTVDAQLQALESQLGNALTEQERGEGLLERGVTTVQRLDALRTQVSVFQGRIEAAKAERRVIEQQAAEGAVLAPIAGVVLKVPVTTGAVVLSGEPIGEIGGGGLFLRLAVPERHSDFLVEGVEIQVGEEIENRTGRLAKVYPQIENGRVIADVEVEDLSAAFVDARVLVRLPVAQTAVFLVPAEAIHTRGGLDFVTIEKEGSESLRTVVLGRSHQIDSNKMVEVLSGLADQDKVLVP